MPIIFHNLEVYDAPLIFRELNNFKDIDIQVIPKTNERYMSIIVNNSIVFLDSLQFLKASLDTLAENLQDNNFKHLLSEFSEDKLELLKLPPKESFYSSIDDGKRSKGDRHISYRQYLHLQFV